MESLREVDGWLYAGKHRVCLVGAYRKEKDDCAYWIIHQGYEIHACLLCYSEKMLMRERAFYSTRQDKYPDFCNWIDWRINYFQTIELIRGNSV